MANPHAAGVRRAYKQYLSAQRLAVDSRQKLWAAVADARAHGVTWDEIGEVIGITRQAAHRRFSKPVPKRIV